MRALEWGAEGEGEAGSPLSREPNADLDSRTLGSLPTGPPRGPFCNLFYNKKKKTVLKNSGQSTEDTSAEWQENSGNKIKFSFNYLLVTIQEFPPHIYQCLRS